MDSGRPRYRDRFNLEPLRIRAYLRTGVISDRWLPLDGVLLYQTHRDMAEQPQAFTLPGEYSGQRKVATLPLGIIHPGRKNWYYQCSWAQWSHESEGQDYWNKRFDSGFAASLVNFQGKRGNVIIGSGQYKAYHMPVFYRVTKWVEWYCIGDKKEIEYLLSTLTHIGKKIAQGWGRVIRWEVESIPEDWSIWKDGQLMRGIPSQDAQERIFDFSVGVYGIRPAYWKQSNHFPLVMPV